MRSKGRVWGVVTIGTWFASLGVVVGKARGRDGTGRVCYIGVFAHVTRFGKRGVCLLGFGDGGISRL